jgi:hypothetical protein
VEHRPKVQKYKKERGHNANSPKAHIVTLVVDSAGLLHLHKACFFKQGNGPFTTPLADAGVSDDGSHIYVDKAVFQRGRSQAEGCKVKVRQDCFNDNLASLTAF